MDRMQGCGRGGANKGQAGDLGDACLAGPRRKSRWFPLSARGGCGRKGTALACGAGLAAGRGRRGAASGLSALAGPERSEGEAGRAREGGGASVGPARAVGCGPSGGERGVGRCWVDLGRVLAGFWAFWVLGFVLGFSFLFLNFSPTKSNKV